MSERATSAVLGAISYEVGEPVKLATLPDHSFPETVAREMREYGLTSFARLDRPLGEAAMECVARSLEIAGLAPADIDAVILITESFSEFFPSSADSPAPGFKQVRNRAFDLFFRLGINDASIYCLTYGGCTNLLPALLLAKTMVRGATNRNVLIVAAEKYTTLDSRLMQESISIAGDGVATCIVGAARNAARDSFELDFVGVAPYRNILPGANLSTKLLAMFKAVKNAAADCYETCQLQPRDFRWLVFGDYNREASVTYGRLLGFDQERTFLKNVGRYGHISFDPLINLADLAKQHELHPSDHILLFSCGPTSCGAVKVTPCNWTLPTKSLGVGAG
jgi:3-oxoacyl-[acyl-carrier-protein] synthase III